jgi:hypothetical protein
MVIAQRICQRLRYDFNSRNDENHLQKIRNNGMIYRQNHPESSIIIIALLEEVQKSL